MAATKPASGRRGPSTSAKKASGAVLPPPITFPVNSPAPRQIEPQECVARCIEASADGVRVVVLPRVVDVRHMLDSVYGVLGWGGHLLSLRKLVEMPNRGTLPLLPGQYVRKDAGAAEPAHIRP